MRYTETNGKSGERIETVGIRLAAAEDLPRLREAYAVAVGRMQEAGIDIWNERYPYEAIVEDVACGRLYLMERDACIDAAFALLSASGGEQCIRWKYGGRPLYLYRLAVFGAPRTGLGIEAMQKAAEKAKQLGAQTLRLFVVDTNGPALSFYRKCGYEQAAGVYVDSVADGPLLREYGFEKRICAAL